MIFHREKNHRLYIRIVLILMVTQPSASIALQSSAYLKFKYLTENGVPPRKAIAELFKNGEEKVLYRTESKANGDFLISGIDPGDYILRISTPNAIELVTNVRILANQKINLGTLRGGGLFDFMVRDMHYTALRPSNISLSCREKYELLRDPVPADLWLSEFELEELAIRIQKPKWPPKTPRGYTVTVVLILDESGTVACATVDESRKQDIRAQAAITAALRSKFKPCVRHGVAVPVIGMLGFTK